MAWFQELRPAEMIAGINQNVVLQDTVFSVTSTYVLLCKNGKVTNVPQVLLGGSSRNGGQKQLCIGMN